MTPEAPTLSADPLRLGLTLERSDENPHIVRLVYACEYAGRIIYRNTHWLDDREIGAMTLALTSLASDIMSDRVRVVESIQRPV